MCVCVWKLLSRVQLFVNPLNCSLPGSSVHGIPQAGKNTKVGSCSLPRDLPNPGMERRSPALKVDSFEPPGKPVGTINPEQKRKNKKISLYLQGRRLSFEMLWDFSFFSNRFLKLFVCSHCVRGALTEFEQHTKKQTNKQTKLQVFSCKKKGGGGDEPYPQLRHWVTVPMSRFLLIWLIWWIHLVIYHIQCSRIVSSLLVP